MKKTLRFLCFSFCFATVTFAQTISFFWGSDYYSVSGPSNFSDNTETVWPLNGPGEYVVNGSDWSWLVEPESYEIVGSQWGSGFGTFTLVDNSLPVELQSFSARQEGLAVELQWTTESEKDNLGFILEYSLDENTWQEIVSYKTQDALRGQGNKTSRSEYSYTFSNVSTGNNYFRLTDVNTQGALHSSQSISVQVLALPQETIMEKAYPNPFNPQTVITYKLSDAAQVNITVYDILGNSVKILFNGKQSAGNYQVYWNGTNEKDLNTPTGTYFICMETDKVTQIQKVLYIK